MTTMRNSDFRLVTEPLLNDAFNGVYDQRKDEWKGYMKKREGTKRAYHEEAVMYGLGMAPLLPDGTPVVYRGGGILFNKRYLYNVFGLAYAMTKTLIDDGDHISIGRSYAEHLAQSMIETKETVAANVLNRSLNAAYPGGDQVSLINAAHPILGSTFSNILATPAAFSQTSLEQILIQVRQAVDNDNKKINLQAMKLLVHANNMFQAEAVLKSVLRAGTNNNDLNPIRSMGMLPEGCEVVTRLTSTTAWWVQTDAPRGLTYLERTALAKSMEGDFDTDSMRYKSTERYDMGWTDPRGAYGTQGA